MATISRAGAARLTNHRAREAEVLSGNDGGLSVGEVKEQARDLTHRLVKQGAWRMSARATGHAYIRLRHWVVQKRIHG